MLMCLYCVGIKVCKNSGAGMVSRYQMRGVQIVVSRGEYGKSRASSRVGIREVGIPRTQTTSAGIAPSGLLCRIASSNHKDLIPSAGSCICRMGIV